MAVAELSLELDEARAQLAAIAGVTRLPAARHAAGSLAADTRNSYPAS
jgi:hypothetical protein